MHKENEKEKLNLKHYQINEDNIYETNLLKFFCTYNAKIIEKRKYQEKILIKKISIYLNIQLIIYNKNFIYTKIKDVDLV